MIFFNEEQHKYTNEQGVEYISCTKFIHLFEMPFDSETMASRVAAKRGITKEEVLNEWKQINKESTEKGTAIHKIMEDYIKKISIDSKYSDYYVSFNDIMDLTNQKITKYHSEKLLWNDEYKIAGTADLVVEYDNNEFSIGDFKTNKKFEYYSNYGTRMLNPVSHLSQCQYSTYSLQLSLYACLFSMMTGKKCRNLFLMLLKNNSWNFIPVNYMKEEVLNMLKYNKK